MKKPLAVTASRAQPGVAIHWFAQWTGGLSPHPVLLPLGEGTLPGAPCAVFEAVRL